MTSSIIYKGGLRCQAVHVQSQSMIETDAPVDNKGKGERFSPTDLLCVSLATCIVTTMGIKAADMQIDIASTTMEVTKHMIMEPRSVGKIEIAIHMAHPEIISEKDKTILERAANNCPVKKSLNANVIVDVKYFWK